MRPDRSQCDSTSSHGSDGARRTAEATNELARRVSAEDELEFSRLYERLAPAVHAWVSLRLGRGARVRFDLEDVAQEVWLRAAKAFSQFDPERGSFRTWLFQVTKYTLLETFRALATGPRTVPELAVTSVESGLGSARRGVDLSQVPDSVTTLTRRVAHAEGLARFLEEIEALPPEERELLVICGLEGRPATEAAPQLGLSHEAARKRWLRLRERLAKRAELFSLIE